MPTRPLSPCLHHGCAALVPRGRCEAHAKGSSKAQYDEGRRKADPLLALAARIRSSAQWQKVRALHRRMEPLCRDPFGDHKGWPVPSAHSHHIQSLATAQSLAFDVGNLAGLCVECHSKVEWLERQGKGTAGLFVQSAQCG